MWKSSGRKESTDNFLRQFRTKTSQEFGEISAAELLMIWEHYDRDGQPSHIHIFLLCKLYFILNCIPGNGYLEGDELDKFLREFVTSVCGKNVGSEVKLNEFLSNLQFQKEF